MHRDQALETDDGCSPVYAVKPPPTKTSLPRDGGQARAAPCAGKAPCGTQQQPVKPPPPYLQAGKKPPPPLPSQMVQEQYTVQTTTTTQVVVEVKTFYARSQTNTSLHTPHVTKPFSKQCSTHPLW